MKKVTEIGRVQSTGIHKKLQISAYCRVSTDSDEQLERLENQRTHYENMITNHNNW